MHTGYSQEVFRFIYTDAETGLQNYLQFDTKVEGNDLICRDMKIETIGDKKDTTYTNYALSPVDKDQEIYTITYK